MSIRLRTLGTLRVHRDGEELTWLSAEPVSCALLIYLAVEREDTREALSTVFWPDHGEDRARRALDRTLDDLARGLGRDWVQVRGDRLVAEESVEVDALEFLEAVSEDEVERALALYDGPFLEGGCPPTTRAFQRWVDTWRAKVGRLERRLRREAMQVRLEAGDPEGALDVAGPPVADAVRETAPAYVTGSPVKEKGGRAVTGGRDATGGRGATGGRDATGGPAATDGRGEGSSSGASPSVRTFREEVRARRIVPWVVTYLTAAIAFLEGVSILFGWPAWIQPRLWILFVLGLLIVLVAAWNHGESGIQHVTGPELAAEGVLVTAFVLALVWSPSGPAPPPRAPLTEIAVLPLDDYFSGPERGTLADHLTEALIAELDWSEGIEVQPRAAVTPYASRDVPPDTIARALGVGTIVEGSVHDVGEQLRLNLQLFDAGTRHHLLTDTLSMPLEDREGILKVLPGQAARALLQSLGREVRRREARARTGNEEAWRLYDRALRIVAAEDEVRRALGGLERADSLLAAAEHADSDWPDPTLQRARIWKTWARNRAEPGENYEPRTTREAIRLLDAALDKHPAFAPALAERGVLLFELGENQPVDSARVLWDAAERDLRAAVDTDPHSALGWYGLANLYGRLERSRAQFGAARQAREADVFLEYERDLLFYYGFAAFDIERHEEARRACARGRRLYPRDDAFVQCRLMVHSAAPSIEPDPAHLRALADTLVALVEGTRNEAALADLCDIWVAKGLARAGMADSARAVLRPHRGEEAGWHTFYDHAHARVLLDEPESALDLLERYARRRPARAASLASDWYFRPLVDDPRFRALTRRAPGG